MLGLFGALAITGGLLLLVLKLLQRLHGNAGRRGILPFAIVQRHSLAPKQGILVTRIGNRVLVLATSDKGVRLLTELRGEDRQVVLAHEAEAALDHPAPKRDLRRLFARLTLSAVIMIVGWGVNPLEAQARPDSVRRAPISPSTAVVPSRADTVKRMTVSPPTSVAPRTPRPPVPLPDNLKIKGPEAPTVEVTIGRGNEAVKLSGTVGLVVFMGALTLLPAMFLLMTSFTRILIVLHFLRSAIGTQSSPPTQLLVAIAVLLTGVVMNPVIQEVNKTTIQPYLEGHLSQTEAYTRGIQPFRQFMLANVRERDLATFTELSGVDDAATIDDIPTLTIVTAFVTSELQAAFWMGFVIFLPFVIVDLVVATTLMSLGMFMLPPVMISLPFKLLLFVLADGWSLVGQNLVASFRH
ncbi:MAG: flagellar type III secretion system pore protein FliP [Gemmatimonadota bacterium]